MILILPISFYWKKEHGKVFLKNDNFLFSKEFGVISNSRLISTCQTVGMYLNVTVFLIFFIDTQTTVCIFITMSG